MTLHGDSTFVFEFSSDEDRQAVLEQGHVYIASRLFTIRPWYPMVEKMVEDLKTIPVWFTLKKILTFMWNQNGIGIIASYLGIPLMTDKKTLERSRMNFARVCMEIDTSCDFPSEIPVVIDGVETFTVTVECSWKPPKCNGCKTFDNQILSVLLFNMLRLKRRRCSLVQKFIEVNGL